MPQAFVLPASQQLQQYTVAAPAQQYSSASVLGPAAGAQGGMQEVRSLMLSPRTWQLEPSPTYASTSAMLAAGFGAAAAAASTAGYYGGGGTRMVPSPTSDN